MMKDEAVNSAMSVPSVNTGEMPAGLNPGGPEEVAALEGIQKSRGSMWDTAKSAIMGAGMGAQAGQGSGNALAAFIQGAAVGMQAPAQIYEQKRKQIESALDASPFGVTHPEIATQPGYEMFKGWPTKLALETIKTIATDAAKVAREGEQSRMTQQAKFDQDVKLKGVEAALKGKDPISLKDQMSIAKDFEGLEPVKQYNIVAPAYETIVKTDPSGTGDKVAVIKFAQMLNPSVRVNDQTLDAMDASGTLDKFTGDAWRKVKTGNILGPEERRNLIREATKIYHQRKRDYNEVSDMWREKAVEGGFDPNVITSGNYKAEMLQLKDGSYVKAVKRPDGKYEVIE